MERPRGEWGRAEPEKEGEICRDEEMLRREAASCWVGGGGDGGQKGGKGANSENNPGRGAVEPFTPAGTGRFCVWCLRVSV